jgi:uncharacterized protein (TIGR02246 family)
MRALAAVAVAVAAVAAPAHADAPARADSAAAIRAVLDRQVAAWNAGDIDGFMSGYQRGPDTVMVAHELLRGWDAIRARYRSHYPTKAKMGTLAFEGLEIRALGDEWALVIGRFRLARAESDGGAASGSFTLTLHQTRDGWRIVVDHTS